MQAQITTRNLRNSVRTSSEAYGKRVELRLAEKAKKMRVKSARESKQLFLSMF